MTEFCTERMLVVLRDYKVLIGYLRSVDQFGKLLCLLRTMCVCVCVQQQKPDGTVGVYRSPCI